MSAAEVKWVVVDWYWRDQKLRRFSDVPEVLSQLSQQYQMSTVYHNVIWV